MKIFVPTDFSEQSEAALDLAVGIARLGEGEVLIHHAHSSVIDWVAVPMEEENRYPSLKESINLCKKRLQELEERFADAKVSTQLSFLETVDELLKEAKKEGVDWIVSGTHGRKDLSNRIMGSDSQRMIRLAECPVIVLRKPVDRFPWKNILFVTDLNDDVSRPLEKLVELCELMDAKLHLGYVNSPVEFRNSDETARLMSEILERAPGAGIETHVFNHVRIDQGIKRLAEILDADAIALATHSRSAWFRLFSQSLTEAVAMDSDLPVISFHL